MTQIKMKIEVKDLKELDRFIAKHIESNKDIVNYKVELAKEVTI